MWWPCGPLILMEKLKQNVIWFTHGERQMSWSSSPRHKGFRYFWSESTSLAVEPPGIFTDEYYRQICHDWHARISTLLWRNMLIKTCTSQILWDFQRTKFPKLSIIKRTDETDWIRKKMGKMKCYFITVEFVNKTKHFIGFNLAFLWWCIEA